MPRTLFANLVSAWLKAGAARFYLSRSRSRSDLELDSQILNHNYTVVCDNSLFADRSKCLVRSETHKLTVLLQACILVTEGSSPTSGRAQQKWFELVWTCAVGDRKQWLLGSECKRDVGLREMDTVIRVLRPCWRQANFPDLLEGIMSGAIWCWEFV